MKEFFRIIIIFFLCCGIVFLSYNIYSYAKGNDDNFFSIATNLNSTTIESKGTLVKKTDNLKDSGIDGEEYTFNSNYYPYYALLSNNNKKIYKQVYANALNYESTFVPIVDIKVNDLLTVIESVLNDHPELFWLGNSFSYKYDNDNICKQITLNFNGTQDDKNSFYKVANEIINNARVYSTDYEKELYVHDTLIQLIEYDKNQENNQSAYSALVNNKTVCAGYARSFQYIMMQLGIPTYYVTGMAEGEEHAWNVVKLSDGYYNVDLTWDDELHSTHTFFNKTDQEFSQTHSRSTLSSKLVSCNSIAYEFSNMSNKQEEEFVYHDDNEYVYGE